MNSLSGLTSPTPITTGMMNAVAGVALNGVLIMGSTSRYHDPYFPKTWTQAAAPASGEDPDSCMGSITTAYNSIIASVYHYKMLSPCILEAINVA